jgi:3-hydroxyacyl-[acyl-carrier-protein] dehydratase
MSGVAPEAGTPLPDVDYAGVLRMLPHRYPMLLVDRVVELVARESAVGVKNVTFNEPYFPGHFPSDPIMPGVLLVEALGQTAAVLMIASLGTDTSDKSVYFMSIDGARFRRPVRPGDEVRLAVRLQKARLGVWRFEGQALVAGQVASQAEFSAKLVDR